MSFKDTIGTALVNAKDAVVKASPDILIVAGVVGLVGTAVLAVKAYKKTTESEEIADAEDKLQFINNTEAETEEHATELKEGKKKYSIKLVREYLKIYAPVVLLGLASIGMIFTGHGVLKHRLQITSAALAVTEQMFEQYRKNVIEKYGAEEDEALYNGFKTTLQKFTDENGEEHEEEVKTSKMADISPLAVFYGPDYNRFVKNDPNLTKAELMGFQKEFQDRINCNKWAKLTIRDILVRLGYDDSYTDSNDLYLIYGYRYGDKVDLGVYDNTIPGNANFVMGRTDTCLLNFNGAHRLIDFA